MRTFRRLIHFGLVLVMVASALFAFAGVARAQPVCVVDLGDFVHPDSVRLSVCQDEAEQRFTVYFRLLGSAAKVEQDTDGEYEEVAVWLDENNRVAVGRYKDIDTGESWLYACVYYTRRPDLPPQELCVDRPMP